MRLYLDVCCLNRPLDDLSIGRNRLEAEAVLEVIRHIRSGHWEMVGSEVVDTELSLTPSAERRAKASALAGLRSSRAVAGPEERERAAALLALGFGYFDALHIACAESNRCDVLLTTDDGMIAKYRLHSGHIMVRIANPLRWIAEVSTP